MQLNSVRQKLRLERNAEVMHAPPRKNVKARHVSGAEILTLLVREGATTQHNQLLSLPLANTPTPTSTRTNNIHIHTYLRGYLFVSRKSRPHFYRRQLPATLVQFSNALLALPQTRQGAAVTRFCKEAQSIMSKDLTK